MESLNITGFVLTAVFGILSVFLYFRGRRYKRLTFTWELVELHSRTHPEIEVAFRGRPVQNLGRLRVVCWNSGTDAIRWTDIPEDAPPRLAIPGAQVLSALTTGSKRGTAFQMSQANSHSAAIRFEYLNPGDCGCAEVIYESSMTELPTVDYQAQVIGGRPHNSRAFAGVVRPDEWTLLVFIPLSLLALAYSTRENFVRSFTWIEPDKLSVKVDILPVVGLMLIGAIAFAYFTRDYSRRFRNSRIPVVGRDFLSGRPNKALALQPPSSDRGPAEELADGGPGSRLI